MSNGRQLSPKAEKGSVAAGVINFFSPAVKAATGKDASAFIEGPTKGGRGGGRASQGSADRAAVEEFDAAEARKRVAARNAARQKTGTNNKNTKPETILLPKIKTA